MSYRLPHHLVLGTLIALSAPLAQAADVSLAGVTWTGTGNTGLISGNYNATGTDALLGHAGTGSPMVGFVSTYHEVIDFDQPYVNPSPLNLVPTVNDFGSYNQTNGSMAQSSVFTVNQNDRLVLHFNYVSTDGRDYEDYAWARLVNAGTHKTAAWLFTARSGNAPDGDGTSDYIQGHVLSDQVGFGDLDSKDPDRQLAVTLPVVPGINGNTQWAPLGPSAGQCWDEGTSCGYTGWVESSFLASDKAFASGSYYLQIGVANWGDTALQSAVAFDFSGLSQANFVNPTQVFDAAAPVPEPEGWAMLLVGLGVMGFLARRRGTRAA